MEDVRDPRHTARYVPLFVTVGVGVLVILGAFLIFRNLEETRLRLDFENMSSDRAQAIRSSIAEEQLELGLISDYVSASSELSRGDMGPFVQEFARLARRISTHEEDIQVIAFLSVVPSSERRAFEVLMRKDVDEGFVVRELDANGALHAAGERTQYFPIAVMEPERYSGAILGLDVMTVPALRSAIEHAIASGKLTASAVVDLPLSASGSQVVWNFRAIHRGARTSDVAASHTGLVGVCVAAFRIDQMADASLRDLSPAGIDLELRDADAPSGQRALYYHPSRTGSSVIKNGMTWSTTIDAGERRWTLVAYPTQSFVSRHRSWQSWTILVGGLVLTGFAGIMLLGRLRRAERVEALVAQRTQELATEVSKHETLERVIAESRSALTAQIVQLNQKNQQIQLLNEAGDSLQSCLTSDEAYATVSIHAPRLLPGTSGRLFSYDPAKDLFRPTAVWGDRPPADHAFKAEDCWALRRGKTHGVTLDGTNLPCAHSTAEPVHPSLCIPLAAIGKTIGLLHVTGTIESAPAFAESVAEHIGLALSNLMLRSDLRELSIHDPLTGLYNRRYMEETLETELRRAERKSHPIGVIMLDIDHFKTFNDGFGHAAGDQMLRAIGGLILSLLRAGDIACRYGGEEILLILPEATSDGAAHRAEEIRSRAKKLEVSHMDRALGPVTVSLGVAVYPGNGRARDELLTSADQALYEAKQGGRDRVVVSATVAGGGAVS